MLVLRWQDVDGMLRFDNMLKVLSSSDSHNVLRKAVNRAGETAYKGRGPSVIRTLAKQTGLPQKLIRKAVRVKRANFASLEYRLDIAGGEISLKYFGARETRKGVTARPFGKRELFDGAFMKGGRFPNRVTARGLNGHVFRRVGSGRVPLEKIKSGVVLPTEMVSGDTAAGFQQIVRQVLPRRTMHELNRATGGAFK